MKVAGVQMDLEWETPKENFRRARSLVGEAAANGARLSVLPEMFATGFSMDAKRVMGFAEETRVFLSDLAAEMGLFVLGGYAEPGDPLPTNTAGLFDPAGREILHYEKIHPFSLAGEDRHFKKGNRVGTVEVEGVRVTPLICYDLRFPELFRAVARQTDLFCVLANWPRARRHHWSLLLEARAIENQAYVLGVNRVGEGNGLEYTGDSAFHDPMGKTLGSIPPASAGVLTAELDPGLVAEVRARFGFLDDRRPELYQQLETAAQKPT